MQYVQYTGHYYPKYYFHDLLRTQSNVLMRLMFLFVLNNQTNLHAAC